MKFLIISILLAGLPMAAIAETKTEAKTEKPEKAQKPRIEVCFVLDTTGSMSGLIEGAKRKIWSIANDIVAAKPTPEVRFALVGYRDRKDDYVTKRVAMTDDLDAVHAELTKFKADGGGDTPESVSEALDEAVQKLEWTKDRSVLKIIYLVGDAPPQNYKDGKDWKQVCQDAVKSDIIINTVQCGDMSETAEIWKSIANKAEGSYVALAQDGNMAVVAAPQDKELAELSAKLGTTIIAYGDSMQRNAVRSKQAAADLAPASATGSVADRAVYNWKTGKSVQGEGELLDALAEKKVSLEKVKKEELPEELRKMTPEELKAHIEKMKTQRAEIQKRIAELSKARDAYIEEERKKIVKGKADSFDEQVAKTLRTQAKKKGIRYE